MDDRTSGAYDYSNWIKKNFTSNGNISWHEQDKVNLTVHRIFNATHV
ncbi:MAG: hypothetical protein L3K15_06905 [Thermoplasmata archaeon]|nr:hypothetical protein [Thermoplasmata archaeon]